MSICWTGELVKQSQVTLKEYSGCWVKEKGKHEEISQSPRDRRGKDWEIRTIRTVNWVDNLVRLDT